MKKIAALFVCAAMCLSFCSSACCAALSGSAEVLADADEVQAILLKYETEIDYLEQKHGIVVGTLTQDILEMIKSEAITGLGDPHFRFSQLVDELATACAKYSTSSNVCVMTREYVPGYVVANEEYTTIVSYTALKGKHFIDVPVGSTATQSLSTTISVEAGEVVQGVGITVGVNLGISYSVSGPADGTFLSNGEPASHRTAFGVLFGTISRYEYDLVFTETGTVTHVTQYIILPASRMTASYTSLTCIGFPTYMQRPNANNWIVTFSNPTVFHNAIVNEPAGIVGNVP